MKITVDTDLLNELSASRTIMFSYLLAKPYAYLEEMAEDLHLCRTAVIMGLKDLEALGYITRLKIKGKRNTDKLVGARIEKR
jgi:DNA-binding transcriptional regulator GbsR (MarR family)